MSNRVGKVTVEGKVEHKFDMKPHSQNLEEYSKMCRERTKKSMVKNRQLQVTFCVWIWVWWVRACTYMLEFFLRN